MAPVSSLNLKNSNIISYIISYSYAGCLYTIQTIHVTFPFTFKLYHLMSLFELKSKKKLAKTN